MDKTGTTQLGTTTEDLKTGQTYRTGTEQAAENKTLPPLANSVPASPSSARRSSITSLPGLGRVGSEKPVVKKYAESGFFVEGKIDYSDQRVADYHLGQRSSGRRRDVGGNDAAQSEVQTASAVVEMKYYNKTGERTSATSRNNEGLPNITTAAKTATIPSSRNNAGAGLGVAGTGLGISHKKPPLVPISATSTTLPSTPSSGRKVLASIAAAPTVSTNAAQEEVFADDFGDDVDNTNKASAAIVDTFSSRVRQQRLRPPGSKQRSAATKSSRTPSSSADDLVNNSQDGRNDSALANSVDLDKTQEGDESIDYGQNVGDESMIPRSEVERTVQEFQVLVQQQIAELRAGLEQKEQEFEQKQQELQELKDKFAQLSVEAQQDKQKAKTFQERAESNEEALSDYNTKMRVIEEKEKQIRAAKEENSALKAELQQAAAALEEIERKISQQQLQLEAVQKLAAQKTAAASSAEESVASALAAEAAAKAQLEKYKQQALEVKDLLQEREQINTDRKALDLSQKEFDERIEQRNDELRRQLQEVNERMQELQSRQRELTEKERAFSEKESSQQFKGNATTVDASTDPLDANLSDGSALTEQLNSLRKGLEELRGERDRLLDDATAEARKAQRATEDRIARLEQEHKEKLDDAERKIQEKVAEAEKALKLQQKAQQEALAAQGEVGQLQEKNAKLLQELNQAQNGVLGLRGQLGELQPAFEALKGLHDALDKKFKESEKAREEAKREAESANSDAGLARKQKEQAEKERDVANEEREASNVAARQEKLDREAAEKRARDAEEKEKKTLAEAEKDVELHNQILAGLQKENAGLRENLAELDQKNKALKQGSLEAEEKIKKALAKIDELTEAQNVMAGEAAALKGKLAELEKRPQRPGVDSGTQVSPEASEAAVQYISAASDMATGPDFQESSSAKTQTEITNDDLDKKDVELEHLRVQFKIINQKLKELEEAKGDVERELEEEKVNKTVLEQQNATLDDNRKIIVKLLDENERLQKNLEHSEERLKLVTPFAEEEAAKVIQKNWRIYRDKKNDVLQKFGSVVTEAIANKDKVLDFYKSELEPVDFDVHKTLSVKPKKTVVTPSSTSGVSASATKGILKPSKTLSDEDVLDFDEALKIAVQGMFAKQIADQGKEVRYGASVFKGEKFNFENGKKLLLENLTSAIAKIVHYAKDGQKSLIDGSDVSINAKNFSELWEDFGGKNGDRKSILNLSEKTALLNFFHAFNEQDPEKNFAKFGRLRADVRSEDMVKYFAEAINEMVRHEPEEISNWIQAKLGSKEVTDKKILSSPASATSDDGRPKSARVRFSEASVGENLESLYGKDWGNLADGVEVEKGLSDEGIGASAPASPKTSRPSSAIRVRRPVGASVGVVAEVSSEGIEIEK